MFDPIDLSYFADAVMDEVVSGVPKIDGTILLDLARQAQEPILELGCGFGRRCGVAHRHTDVTTFESGRIIHAVACHRHDMALFLERLHDLQLILRRDAGVHRHLLDDTFEFHLR